MIENNEERLERKLLKVKLNSINYFALTSYLIYLIYTTTASIFLVVILISIYFYSSGDLPDLDLNSIDIKALALLTLIGMAIIIFLSFILWIFTFYDKFKPSFYEEQMQPTIGKAVFYGDLVMLILLVLSFPAYYLTKKLPFKANDTQLAVRKEQKSKGFK